jgi:hypothetical protein
VLSRHIKNGKEPRPSVLQASPTPERGNVKRAATTEGQASGGARLEWRAAWRDKDNGCGIEVLD